MNRRWDIKIPGQVREVSPNSYYINIRGVDYHYRVFHSGKKKARDIVLLHGFSSSTYTWEKIDRRLCDAGYNVWALDMRGFGWSDKPRNSAYDPMTLLEDLNEWMEYMGLRHTIFVGNSYGGGMGMMLAHSYPNRVDKLVVIDPGAYRMKLPLIMRLIRMPVPEKLSTKFFGRWMVKWILTQVMYNRSLISEHQVDNYYLRMLTPNALHAQIALSKAIDFDQLDIYTRRLNEIDQETLIIWGRNDAWIPVSLGYRMRDALKNSTLVVLNECGHMPQEEKPDAVYTLIIDFLGNKTPGTSLGPMRGAMTVV